MPYLSTRAKTAFLMAIVCPLQVAAALMQSRAGAVTGAAAAAAAAAVAGTEVPCSRAPGPLLDRRLKPHAEQPQKCPRCDSLNTKFCYYNNYSLSQPRYFCKTCRRYWTKGGTLRNVPVGGGCRKNKRAKRTVDQAPSSHGGGGGAASSDEQTSPSDTANPNNSSNLSNPSLNPSSNPSPSLDSDQAGVSGSSMYGFEELSAAAAAAAAAGYGFNPSSRSAVMVSGPLQQHSSLSHLAGLQSALKGGFPGIPDQSSGLSSMADLSCILQQHPVQIGGLTMPLDAYGAIDPQWQRLMQQQQQQNLRPPPPLEDRQVSLLPLDLQQQQSGKASEEANRARIVAGQSQNWQIPQEGFFEASSTDTHNASPFWNTATTGAGVAGSSWPDLSGFGPSSSGSLL